MKIMKVLFIVTFLTFLTFQPFNTVHSLAGKPRGPLSLILSADPSPTVGAVIEITFTVTSRMDAPGLVLSIELPEDLLLADGALRWTGAATKGQPVSLAIRVGPLAGQHEIIGRATVTLPLGPGQPSESTWTQAASIILEPEAHPPKAEKPLPRLKYGRQGQAILEILVQ